MRDKPDALNHRPTSTPMAFSGFKAQALAVTTDPEHQFDLALHLGDLKTAVDVASNPAVSTEQKWKQLAEVATRQCDFKLAQHCLHQVKYEQVEFAFGSVARS